ncbi:polymeric immunoglobulin receptor-like isoform X4 [Xiphias gladius]|uniref:polymeric immunoglobulin receptor-like isoform X4 n=1 Tax=Xiphias gladius TaxID=8245 RepID=UPI001A994172|nr:polymeric immunoglobulin receptor-like isoform X4 [Xiphias gladius]
MNVHHLLFFGSLSALCGGDSGLVRAKLNIYTGAEGGNGTLNCYLTLPGSRKFLCKGECKGENILIKTDDVRANNGRFSLEYRNKSAERGIVSVTFTHLTKTDSGWYRCGLGTSLVPDSYTDFDIRVSDAEPLGKSGFLRTDTEGENVTYPCMHADKRSRMFFCKGECTKEEDILIETDQTRAQNGRYGLKYQERSVFGLYLTITRVAKSDTGRYRCGYGRALSPESYYVFSIVIVDAPTKPTKGQPATTAPTTSKPSWTRRPFSTSVPLASTATTRSLGSGWGSSATPSVFSESTAQFASYFLPLVVCAPLVGVLLVVAFLLLLYIRKTRTTNSRNTEVTFFDCVCLCSLLLTASTSTL